MTTIFLPKATARIALPVSTFAAALMMTTPVCSALVNVAPPPAQRGEVLQVRERRPQYDPCTDGRFSVGRPIDCRKVYGYPRPRPRRLPDGYDPCTDGRFSSGRPIDCRAVYGYPRGHFNGRGDRGDEPSPKTFWK